MKQRSKRWIALLAAFCLFFSGQGSFFSSLPAAFAREETEVVFDASKLEGMLFIASREGGGLIISTDATGAQKIEYPDAASVRLTQSGGDVAELNLVVDRQAKVTLVFEDVQLKTAKLGLTIKEEADVELVLEGTNQIEAIEEIAALKLLRDSDLAVRGNGVLHIKGRGKNARVPTVSIGQNATLLLKEQAEWDVCYIGATAGVPLLSLEGKSSVALTDEAALHFASAFAGKVVTAPKKSGAMFLLLGRSSLDLLGGPAGTALEAGCPLVAGEEAKVAGLPLEKVELTIGEGKAQGSYRCFLKEERFEGIGQTPADGKFYLQLAGLTEDDAFLVAIEVDDEAFALLYRPDGEKKTLQSCICQEDDLRFENRVQYLLPSAGEEGQYHLYTKLRSDCPCIEIHNMKENTHYRVDTAGDLAGLVSLQGSDLLVKKEAFDRDIAVTATCRVGYQVICRTEQVMLRYDAPATLEEIHFTAPGGRFAYDSQGGTMEIEAKFSSPGGMEEMVVAVLTEETTGKLMRLPLRYQGKGSYKGVLTIPANDTDIEWKGQVEIQFNGLTSSSIPGFETTGRMDYTVAPADTQRRFHLENGAITIKEDEAGLVVLQGGNAFSYPLGNTITVDGINFSDASGTMVPGGITVAPGTKVELLLDGAILLGEDSPIVVGEGAELTLRDHPMNLSGNTTEVLRTEGGTIIFAGDGSLLQGTLQIEQLKGDFTQTGGDVTCTLLETGKYRLLNGALTLVEAGVGTDLNILGGSIYPGAIAGQMTVDGGLFQLPAGQPVQNSVGETLAPVEWKLVLEEWGRFGKEEPLISTDGGQHWFNAPILLENYATLFTAYIEAKNGPLYLKAAGDIYRFDQGTEQPAGKLQWHSEVVETEEGTKVWIAEDGPLSLPDLTVQVAGEDALAFILKEMPLFKAAGGRGYFVALREGLAPGTYSGRLELFLGQLHLDTVAVTLTKQDKKDPVDPIEPIEPTDPVKPMEPIEPADPVIPEGPTDPAVPVPTGESRFSGVSASASFLMAGVTIGVFAKMRRRDPKRGGR